jgi:HSP20 family protein
MRIIRYQNSPVFSPAGHFPSLREEMDRLFDVAFPTLSSLQREGLGEDFPIDLFREKESFVVRAELPGFRREDLNLEVADGILTVTGHRKTETPAEGQKEEDGVSQEYRVSRSISLPDQVKVDDIQAKYENGVLTVTLPKREEVKPRQITIDVK